MKAGRTSHHSCPPPHSSGEEEEGCRRGRSPSPTELGGGNRTCGAIALVGQAPHLNNQASDGLSRKPSGSEPEILQASGLRALTPRARAKAEERRLREEQKRQEEERKATDWHRVWTAGYIPQLPGCPPAEAERSQGL